MEITLEVKGLQELQAKHEAIAEKLSDGNLVMKAGLVIERQAKINASGRPGPKVQTGRLRASINVKQTGKYTASVGTNVVYAPPVEFGHALRGRVWTSGIRYTHGGITALKMGKSPAYPFLGPTISQTIGQIDGVMVTFGSEIEGMYK
jgi:HK97 gp10 family phage protein